jgi:hypothetical protein
VLNGDSVILDGPSPALARMAASFDPATMDGLLLVVRTAQVDGEVGRGDFHLDRWAASAARASWNSLPTSSPASRSLLLALRGRPTPAASASTASTTAPSRPGGSSLCA